MKNFSCYTVDWDSLNKLHQMAAFEPLVVSHNLRTPDETGHRQMQIEIHLNGKLVAQSEWI